MCSQYTIKTSAIEILEEIALEGVVPEAIDERILPSSLAPIIVKDKAGLKLTPMKFSLVPSWSKEPKVKFATHNARIESVLEKPTWKQPFISQHCVVPMTSFYESAYSGPLAGNIINFSDTKDHLMFAAGIFDYWKDHEDPKKSFFSFSIVTRDPSDFILEYGHDRTPLFINKEFIPQWLSPSSKDGEEVRSELLKNAIHPHLKVIQERALKPG